jgi:hypothetical protein
MAGTADNITWISLQEARNIVIAVMLTQAYAIPTISKWIAQKRVRYIWMEVFGVPRMGWSLDQEARAVWDERPHRVLLDYKQSSAHKPVHYPNGWKGYITIIGIRVAREDIEAALAADYPGFAAASLPLFDGPPQPAAELTDARPARPRNRRWQRTEAILKYLYPQIPSEDKVRKGDLVHAVERNWNSPEVPNPEKLPVPSPDTIERVVDDLRSRLET